ncbi:MAG TPA: homogentisate 1,2-dioxygenase, partial [Caulobacteraceae bacterium]
MSKRNWIPVRGAQGKHSRQAHADLPDGTYEREVSKEGFFGPAAFLYHRRPPTGWTSFDGPLRPRAFDLNRLNEAAPSPWNAPVVL